MSKWLVKPAAALVATRVRAFVLGLLSLPLGVEAVHLLLGVEVLRKLCGS